MQQPPDLLGQLPGGRGAAGLSCAEGMLSNPMAKRSLGGIAAYGLTRVLSGGHGSGLFGGGGHGAVTTTTEAAEAPG